MPAKNIIILEKNDSGYRVAFWADVPATRQSFYANPIKRSLWGGASTEENAAIAAGTVTESAEQINVPAGATIPQMQAFLESRWTAFQSYITSYNPWLRYGTFWNGTTWTAGGVS